MMWELLQIKILQISLEMWKLILVENFSSFSYVELTLNSRPWKIEIFEEMKRNKTQIENKNDEEIRFSK